MTRTLVLANQKGGVAKTTSVVSLGAALAELGRRVLLVDLDPQACLTFSVGQDPEDLDMSVHDVLLGRVGAGMAVVGTEEGVDLLPACIDLAGIDTKLATRPRREFVLAEALATVADRYDDILLDAPPSLGLLTIAALTAADEVLIPLQCEALSHRGVGQLLDTVQDVQRLTNPGLRVLGVLPTLYDARTAHARAVLADISGRYGLEVRLPAVPRSVRFAEAPTLGRSILRTAHSSAGAAAYRAHARALAGLPPAAACARPAADPEAGSAGGGPVAVAL